MLALSPIENIICGNKKDAITLTMNIDGDVDIFITYYDKDGFVIGDSGVDKSIESKKGQELEYNIETDFGEEISLDMINIEVKKDGEVLGEARFSFPDVVNGEDFTCLVTDSELIENIAVKYTYNNGFIYPDNEITLKNVYKFNNLNEYILPKIIELDKLNIDIDESYKFIGYTDCYLLLNHGLKGSCFRKSEEDFYKVPLVCDIKEDRMNFYLDKEYYYDFNSCSMKDKKSNNSVKVNDIILSKNDLLLTEGYLVIDKFGYYQKSFQLDLLLNEKPLFGRNGYYTIKKIS